MGIYYYAVISAQPKYRLNTWPDESNGINVASISAAITAIADDDTLVIDGGSSGKTYSESVNFSRNVLMRGSYITDPDGIDHAGLVTIQRIGGASAYGVTASVGKEVRLENLKLKYELASGYQGVYIPDTRAGLYVDAIVIKTIATIALYSAAPVSQINELLIRGEESPTKPNAEFSGATGDHVITNSIFLGGKESIKHYNGSVSVHHSLLFGSQYSAVSGASANCVLNNCIVQGCALNVYAPTLLGTGIANNCVITAAPKRASESISSAVAAATWTLNDCIHESPQLKSGNQPAVLVFNVDDAQNIDYFQTMCGYADTYGWKMTMGYSGADAQSEATEAKVVALAATGHEFACHAQSFSNDLTDLNGISIQYTGTGTCSLTIPDNGVGSYSDSIVTSISGGAGETEFNIDISDMSINEVVSLINADASYTATKVNGNTTDGIRAKYLQPQTVPDISSSTPCPLLNTYVYRGELVEPKAYIESIIGTCETFICPGNATDATLQAAIKAAGFIGARGDTSGDYDFSSINIYYIRESWVGASAGAIFTTTNPTDVQIERAIASIATWLQYRGGVLCIGVHNAAEMTLTRYQKIFEEVNKTGVMVKSLSSAIKYIKANGSTSDDFTYTRSLTRSDDILSMGEIGNSSPCIDAGIWISGVNEVGTLDPWGVPVFNLPNIGADQSGLSTENGVILQSDVSPEKYAISGVSFLVDRLQVNTGAAMTVSVGSGAVEGTIDTIFFGPIAMPENGSVAMNFGASGLQLGSAEFVTAESDSAGYARVFISGRLVGRPPDTVVGSFTYEGVLSEDDYNFTLTTDIYDEVL